MAVTSQIGLPQMTAGEVQKHDKFNTLASKIAAAAGGTVDVAVTTGTVTLNETQSRNMRFRFTGNLSGNVTVIINPAYCPRLMVLINAVTLGAFSLTVKVLSGGSGVALAASARTLITHDGTDLIAASAAVANSTVGAIPYLSAASIFSDSPLLRTDANTIEQRNGVTAQASRIYNTYTDASNYERAFARWSSNRFEIGSEAAGTGTARNTRIINAGTLNGSIEFADAAGNVRASVNMASGLFETTGIAINPAGTNARFSDTDGIILKASHPLEWESAAFGARDLRLFRDAAAVLAQRDGTNPQTSRLYNTYTDASNYERAFLRWATNVLEIGTEAAGTGSARSMTLKSAGQIALYAAGSVWIFQDAGTNWFQIGAEFGHWNINSSGHFTAGTDNSKDIGKSGANRPRTIYVGTSLITPSITIDATNGRAITGVLSQTATLDFGSISANTTAELTITVTGAAVGDAVQVNPNGAPESGLMWSGYVSAVNTVTVRLGNVTTGAIDPASRTWRATVTKF